MDLCQTCHVKEAAPGGANSCDRCWELRSRIERDPNLAQKILREMLDEQRPPVFVPPAFPLQSWLNPNNGEYEWGQPGMTLRDYFAAHAPAEEIDRLMPTTIGDVAAKLQALGWIERVNYAFPSRSYTQGHVDRLRAWARYQYADHLLAIRGLEQEAP